jgi:hypothetical protein
VNALANEKVGEFFAKHIVATYQKVGTFQIVNGQKQGGNVASYFCLGDGTVLHAIAGPVDADTMLREAKWVVETRKLALVEGPDKYSDVFRRAHADRLMAEYGVHVDVRSPVNARNVKVAHKMVLAARRGGGDGNNALLVHKLLAEHSLPKIETIYKYVFETILNQKISTQPVTRNGA